ncbi:synaptopodin 2-like protein [Gouania willdenowi]|uniref:Synaptopodin 2-like protein n=1 Tax=Gouania willdenowi TaxID=441366 RepID=A0A8C5HJU2_GOUWI|nr:synaptopodin 2-like protein [Gouania willdenowi]
MVAEELVVSLSGGAPWGFRLQGGAELHKPLQVAKVRRRSKACRAGLKEHDELVAIGDQMCAELSHAQAMSLIDSQCSTLSLRVKRAPPGLHVLSHSGRSPSSLIPTSLSLFTPTERAKDLTSPPDSEAYYGETDSDADTQSHTHRRQRRTPPHARSPARHDNQDEETSEMSGYESATDASGTTQEQWEGLLSVQRRDLLYPPLQTEWSPSTHTPHTLTPHTFTPTPDQVEAEGEGDSGFQEAPACVTLSCPPLVSPQRAKEALMLSSATHLVPMVGPQQSPVSDELSTTYMDKARQAKLQRGESLVEKQVKEARTKCRSIASLLTDAPNPNSKGVLMFKKRRQRAKKYTLTCFGKAEGDQGGDTEGETGGETEEEGGSSALSGSEVDEEGFSASFDPTWDSGYLDLLDRRSSACPSTAPTTPTTPSTPVANKSLGLDTSGHQTPQLAPTVTQSPRLEVSGLDSSITNISLNMSPPAVVMTNGGSVNVSRANVVLSSPNQTPVRSLNGHHDHPECAPTLDPGPNQAADSLSCVSSNPSSLNRTARPFYPGPLSSRPTVTSVMFRPPQPKPTALTMANKPVAAVSMVAISPNQYPSDAKRAVSSTSLYIPPRNINGNTHTSDHSPPSALSPPSSLSSTQFSQPSTSPNTPHPPPVAPPSTPFSPPAVPPLHPLNPLSTCISSPPNFFPHPPDLSPLNQHHPAPHATQPLQPPSCSNIPVVVTPAPQQASTIDSLATREERISIPAARTGILHDARRRSNKKPMFSAIRKKDVCVNPDLLSMVQNMDDHFGKAPAAEPGVPTNTDAGHESGPEEDWLRLGAEACNFMQAQRATRPPPVAPKPQAPEVPQLGGKGGQLFARRQHRMDRYTVERSPSVAAAPYSPAQTREPSPTPSLPATWKYSPNIRAPPPISYNPLLSPSCPLKAQKKQDMTKSGTAGPKGKKASLKPVDIMSHQPYQLNSSLFSYGGGVPQDSSTYQEQKGNTSPLKTARVYEVKRFSTPPPSSISHTPKVIAPRSTTTLGEPLWCSDISSPPAAPTPYQPGAHPSPPQWASTSLFSPPPPAPTGPLPQLPTFSHAGLAVQSTTPGTAQADRQFKSAPDLSPLSPTTSSTHLSRVPRPRFSTSNLGLQASVWRPGSTAQ